MDTPNVLIYAPRGATAYRDWLVAHHCPGTLQVAETPDEASRHIREADVLFCWAFPSALLARAHRLRWIQSMGAGVDDLLRAPELASGVDVARVVGPFGAPIAEYVFAALLSRALDLPRLRAQQARKEWLPFATGTLAGRTMGVAGLGSIGREVVKRARAFGMKVFGLSRTERRADFVDVHFGPGEWLDFVSDLDYLVLTLPLTPQTEHVVGREVLAGMRPEAVLVNVGRGRLVEEDELVAALQAGRLAAAVLDVFETEPLPERSPLWTMENVMVTPHVSGPSAVEAVGSFFLDNLRRSQRGEALVGLADRDRGY